MLWHDIRILLSATINFNKKIEVMKTRIAILTMLLGLFIAGTAMANEPVPATKAATEALTSLLENEISYPAFASENDIQCCVSVSVIVQDDGSLKVDASNCGNCKMKDHVVKSIENLSSKDLAKYAGQNALLKIKFKLIK